jgi:hypothetical protein
MPLSAPSCNRIERFAALLGICSFAPLDEIAITRSVMATLMQHN